MTQSQGRFRIFLIYYVSLAAILLAIAWSWAVMNPNVDDTLFHSLCSKAGKVYLPLLALMLGSFLKANETPIYMPAFTIAVCLVSLWNMLMVLPMYQLLFGPGRTSLVWIVDYWDNVPAVINIGCLAALGWFFMKSGETLEG